MAYRGSHSTGTHKRKATLLVALFVMVQMVVGVLAPVPVRAQLLTKDIDKPVEQALAQVGKALLSAAQNGLVNLASYFMRTIAYDTASYIASGGKGQKSLIFEKGFGEYVKGVASASVGEAIDSLGNEWGIDLCQPPDLNLQAQLKIGLDVTYQDKNGFGADKAGTQSKCSFQQLRNNWSNASGPSLSISAAADFASEVNVSETDFGFALGALERLDALKSTQEKAATLESQVNQGYKAVTDLISGHVNTPAALVAEESKALTGKAEGEKRAEQIAGLYSSQLWQIIPTTASVFLNTLTSQLLNRIFTKGLVPTEKEKGAAFDFYATNSTISKRQIAERAFNFFTATTGKKDSAEYDIALHFASCPDPQNPASDECVMNEDMQKALNEASTQPITLYEAVFEKNYINPNTPLISPRRTADNEDGNCYKDKFCYSNVQKLRKARILPLGFEIAALRSNPDNPWTIGDVLKGFESCTRAADGSIVVSEDTPFCHLINPNWVLRAPQARCENRAYSPDLLTPQSPQRRDECLDVSTCISEDENGNCTNENYYGYCTQEKNVWQLSGETCEAQFASCNTYTNQETNSIVSYLTRTLEYGSCSASSVGCAPYVTERAVATSTWIGTPNLTLQNKLEGRDQVLYFNELISGPGNSCPVGADGCSQFVGATRNSTTGRYIRDEISENYTMDSARQRYLKQAPAYLGCYDTNPTTSAIDYPTTAQQIANNLPTDARCDAYAQVCLAEEVGCDLYDPKGPGESIPGVVGDNFCASTCVGYETFKQEETAFESAQYPMYFIATNGQQCNFQDVGCDEFTNINDANSGGEQLEYYTQIKRCEIPNGNNSDAYYSWEGTEQNGYTLRVHTLAKVLVSSENLTLDYAVGSPAYANERVLPDLYNRCNETNYTARIAGIGAPADADCRALYDDSGTVHYRLLAETVTVSASCHPIRKTESRLEPSTIPVAECTARGGRVEGDSCQVCQGGGTWQADATDSTRGSCVYYAIDAPGESRSCAPQANGCRAYVGNTGNNTKQIFESLVDTFEPVGTDEQALLKAKEAWSPSTLTIAGESITVNGHSLNMSSTDRASRALPAGAMEVGASYELVFWARGAVQSVNIALEQGSATWSFTKNPLINAETPVSIGASWREYRVGPVVFTGNVQDAVALIFDRSASTQKGTYFIDNVELRRTNGVAPLIKNSWKTPEGYDVPLVCDSTPNDGFPGVGLGCREYTTSLNQTVYATGFDRLCREKAVGCAPLWDTQGTTSPLAEVYNARCVNGSVTSDGVLTRTSVPTGKTCEVTIDSKSYSCDIQARDSSCIITTPIAVPSTDFLKKPTDTTKPVIILPSQNGTYGTNTSIAIIDMSSVFVPADTPLESPLFLTDTPAYACKSAELGCQVVAREEQSLAGAGAVYSYTEQAILNRPSQYLGQQGTLCAQEQVACSAFTTTDGVTRFFKDPTANASKLCTYVPSNAKEVDSQAGWFLKTAGRCSNNPASVCSADSDCGTGNTCDEIGTSVACYPEYFENFSSYGLWSNGSQNYQGFVGECPSGQNLCTEFIDPYDTDTSGKNPKGKPYYVINNDALTANTEECGGKASLREGCVLFDQTDVPTKTMTASTTYQQSETLANKGTGQSLVSPVSTSQNDANIILKVDRNRECSEWLSCTSYEPVKTSDGQNAFACAQLGRCTDHEGGVCTGVPTDPSLGTLDNSLLDFDQYVSRDTSWNGAEYTGYSLYNQVQIADLDTVSLKDVEGVDTKNAYIGYVLPNVTCNTIGQSCGPQNKGRCVAVDKCIVPRTGVYPSNVQENIARIAESLGPAQCKVIPEIDSPFSPSVVTNIGANDVRTFAGAGNATGVIRNLYTKRPGQVNVCQGGVPCSCEYTKITYANTQATDYWASDVYRQNAPSLGAWGICMGNFESTGQYCGTDTDCGENGRCNPIEKQQSFVGATGHCLEYDLSRPILGGEGGRQAYACLTWLPVDRTFGRLDTYNVFTEAGYDPTIDAVSPDGGASGQVYCTESTARGNSYEGTLTAVTPVLSDLGQSRMSCGNVNLYINKDSITPANPIMLTDSVHEDGHIMLSKKNSDKTGANAESVTYGSCSLVDLLLGQDAPYPAYVCGVAFVGGEKSCLGGDEKVTLSQAVNALYSFASVWGWKFFGANTAVLRVEADPEGGKGDKFGYKLTDDATKKYTVDALVPRPANEHDTGTFMHPPRFDVPEQPYSFVRSGDKRTLDTRCLVAGGCATSMSALLKSTQLEKDLNLAVLQQVYFVPLRIPDGADGVVPAIFSKELAIDFTKVPESYPGMLGKGGSFLSSDEDKEISPKVKRPNENTIVSYVLERGAQDASGKALPCDGLISFCNYSTSETVNSSHNGDTQSEIYRLGNGANADGISVERNKVYKRYVVTAFTEGRGDDPYFVKESEGGKFFAAVSKATDPFVADCHDGRTNFFAIGMDFNKDGEFLGYISRHCHSESNGNGIQFAVYATVVDQCTEFESVYRNVDFGVANSNKAWTNRVWSQSLFKLNKSGGSTDSMKQSASRSPFGSVALSHEDVNLQNAKSLKGYTFQDKLFGLPLYCQSVFATTTFSLTIGGELCNGLVSVGHDAETVNAIVDWSTKTTLAPDGRAIVNRLFASVYARSTYPFDTISDPSKGGADWDVSNITKDYASVLSPPQILSLNPSTCFPNETSVTCTPGERNNITIGVTNGTSNDYDGDGAPDEGPEGKQIIAEGSYQARASFFAHADDNRMPIRRVMVKWGDGIITNQDIKGLYKNRKAICEASNTPGANTGVGYCTNNTTMINSGITCHVNEDCPKDANNTFTCNTGASLAIEAARLQQSVGNVSLSTLASSYTAPRFGNLPRACEELPFEYYHTYSCDPSSSQYKKMSVVKNELTTETYNKLLANNLTDDSYICVYRPAVQVLDNWGWCNGTCSGREEGCFDDTNGLAQCTVKQNTLLGIDAWTYAESLIVVVP